MIEIPAVIDKGDIGPCGALKGKANGFFIAANDVQYAIGALVFCGFAGAINKKDRRYHGVHRFEPNAIGATDSFMDLPGLAPAPCPESLLDTTVEVVETDGIEIEEN